MTTFSLDGPLDIELLSIALIKDNGRTLMELRSGLPSTVKARRLVQNGDQRAAFLEIIQVIKDANDWITEFDEDDGDFGGVFIMPMVDAKTYGS